MKVDERFLSKNYHRIYPISLDLTLKRRSTITTYTCHKSFNLILLSTLTTHLPSFSTRFDGWLRASSPSSLWMHWTHILNRQNCIFDSMFSAKTMLLDAIRPDFCQCAKDSHTHADTYHHVTCMDILRRVCIPLSPRMNIYAVDFVYSKASCVPVLIASHWPLAICLQRHQPQYHPYSPAEIWE